MPHGAKSYLAAAIALAAGGERLVWIARDAEIGDRVAEELGAWLGDPEAVTVLEPRTALAYERSELIADETAARVAALAAWHAGRARVMVASVQALLQHTITPADLPVAPRELRLGARIHQDALLRELFDLGYVPVTEVAGRGEFGPARRHRRRLPALPLPADPDRVLRRRDRFAALVRSDRPADRRDDRACPAPAGVRVPAAGGRRDGHPRPARSSAARLPERLAADLARFDTEALAPGDGHDRGTADAGRAMVVGDAAEVWAAHLAPATGLDHIGPGTLLVLDEPGDIAEAAAFLWRQADERRAELVESGELPREWPSTYLPPRDWKNRLVGSRTLELTWESEPAEDAAMARGGLSSGDPFGWREPVLPPGRAGRLLDAVTAWRADDARIVLASDQAPRLADILGEGGLPVAVVDRLVDAPPPGAVALIERSLNGGFVGGPDGLAFVTDRELFGTVRIRRPRALRRVVPRDILERLTPGDLVVHIDHGVARYEQMLRRGGAGEDRDYLELSFAGGDRIFVPVEQIGRVTRYSGGERPALSQARRHGMAAGQAARPQGRRRPGRGAARAVRLPRRRAGPRLRAGHARGRPRWRRRSRTRRPSTSSARRPRSRPTWSSCGRWTGWSSAMWATARPRSRCGPPSRPSQDGRQVADPRARPRSSPPSTTRRSRSASPPSRSRSGCCRGSSRPATQAATIAGLADGTVDIVIGRTGS